LAETAGAAPKLIVHAKAVGHARYVSQVATWLLASRRGAKVTQMLRTRPAGALVMLRDLTWLHP
jgi:hypothetical protein